MHVVEGGVVKVDDVVGDVLGEVAVEVPDEVVGEVVAEEVGELLGGVADEEVCIFPNVQLIEPVHASSPAAGASPPFVFLV